MIHGDNSGYTMDRISRRSIAGGQKILYINRNALSKFRFPLISRDAVNMSRALIVKAKNGRSDAATKNVESNKEFAHPGSNYRASLVLFYYLHKHGPNS